MNNLRNGFWGSTEKFCQTKMKTRSCKYGFNFHRERNGIHAVFMVGIDLKDG